MFTKNGFANEFPLMEKVKNQSRVPFKSDSDTVDLWIQTQTISFKKALAQDIYLFEKFFCFLIFVSSKKISFLQTFDFANQTKYLFSVH